MSGIEIELAARLIAGLWCKWRHGKLWREVETRVFPAYGFWGTVYYCPKCKGEVEVSQRLNKRGRKALGEKVNAMLKPLVEQLQRGGLSKPEVEG
jgi:hypothetical protein